MAFTSSLQRIFLGCVALLWLLPGAAFAQQPRAADANYRIRQGDKLSVKFLYHPELSEATVMVRPDGFISLQMIDDLKAEGLTVVELKAQLERAYSESLLNPVVSVSVLEFVAPRVFVGGQVARPGSYHLRDGQTVLQAIILAGGFTREAHRRVVLHARPAGPRQLQVTAVDLTRLLRRSSASREVLLEDGDYVYVPDSKLSKLNHMIEGFRFLVPGYGIIPSFGARY
jgi:protein involved in polysaccharide export with SLBB domain